MSGTTQKVEVINMNIEKKEEIKKAVEVGIQAFFEKNKINVLAINGKLLTSTELGATQNMSAIATNKLLNKAGILEENTDINRTSKWKITEDGQKYAVTPLKFIVSDTDDDNILVRIKEENPKWLGKLEERFADIVKEDKQENIANDDEVQEDNARHYIIIHSDEIPKPMPMTYTVYSKDNNKEVTANGKEK